MNRRQTYEQANKVFDKAMKLEQEFGEYFTGERPEPAPVHWPRVPAAVTSLPALSQPQGHGNACGFMEAGQKGRFARRALPRGSSGSRG